MAIAKKYSWPLFRPRFGLWFGLWFGLLASGFAIADEHDQNKSLSVVTVTASRQDQALVDIPNSIGIVSHQDRVIVGPTHPNETLFRSPGTWISRGSGQESLTAIRSPVLTGPGACGAFQYMENNVPIRPAGFCNVNELFEIDTEQAQRIEVLRGPGTAYQGSNAMHGAINVIQPSPTSKPTKDASIEAGPDHFYRLRLDGSNWDGDRGVRIMTSLTHDGGWRDNSGFDEQKLYVSYKTDARKFARGFTFSATNLNQETAGFIFGEDAYKDSSARKENPNPEAYRDADAQRLVGVWDHAWAGGVTDIRGYLRRSRMEFLQHFLPGQPTEENGQDSAGAMISHILPFASGAQLDIGLDLEFSDGFLNETQARPITNGSPFLMETRPAGKHYDYDVDTKMGAVFAGYSFDVLPDLNFSAAGRLEYLKYEYDNNMIAGNTRDDGTVCGFGGCLFNRPADRTDSFTNFAPKIGAVWSLSARNAVYANLSRGFRVPQATELYRLQRQQSSADIDSEELDSLEIGTRGQWHDVLTYDIAVYYAKKRNFIFRDSTGFNVDDGKTRHRGIEYSLSLDLAPGFAVKTDGSYARHSYDFTRNDPGGEQIVSGDDVDTAPRSIVSTRFEWNRGKYFGETEWLHMGEYYLDGANEHKYEGHDLFNMRFGRRIFGRYELIIRVNNLTDRSYAERADFAFGNYRYLPGRDRSVFFELHGES